MARLPKNYYTDKMVKLNAHKVATGYQLTLDFTPVGRKLDKAQDDLDAAVWDSVEKRMPVGATGALKSETAMLNASTRGEVYLYPPNSDYGHYQYEGELYVDPITGKGAFYSPEYGFWSRPGVTKIPSGRPLNYSQPNAVAHWGEVAIREDIHKWERVVAEALR